VDIRNNRCQKEIVFPRDDAPTVTGARYDIISMLAKHVTLVTSEPIK
jgi:hypothetical protein